MQTNNNYNRGAAMLLFVIFFVVAVSSLLLTASITLYADISAVGSLTSSKQSYLVAEGSVEEVAARIIGGGDWDDLVVLDTLLGVASTTITFDTSTDRFVIRAESQTGRSTRVNVLELVRAPGASFNYGVQSGNGGFTLGNHSTISGNIFSNGIINSSNNASISGDAISAGPDGLIINANIGGNAWANTLQGASIAGDAYYNEDSGSTVGGERFQPYDMPDPEPLPVSNEELDSWQDALVESAIVIRASDSECAGGTYEISSSQFLGNRIIECNLEIRGNNTTVTMDGPIWVQGDFLLQQANVQIDSNLGSQSLYIIVDNPTNRDTSSRITLANSTSISGSGHDDSFMMLVSRNHSAANGGSTVAIQIGQQSSGETIFYTNEGAIQIGQNMGANALTGYQITIGNSTNITYEEGLQSLLFSGGPGGSYAIDRWYQE